MTQPMGMADYFALEAGEYLERLGGLVNAGGAPNASDILRYARALRGSALMANQQAIARAAVGLETLARACRDGARPFDEATAARFASALTEVRDLVTRSRTWTDADTARADALAQDLEAFAGGAVARPRTPTAPPGASQLDPGARAFAARESALVASALGQAAQAIRTAPPAHEALNGVLRRMQPLRGLAALSDLPPLPDLLDGIERAVGELGRTAVPARVAAELLEAGARALTRCARDVTESGRPEPESPEVLQFAEQLLATFQPPRDVVAIEQLLGASPGMIERGHAPSGLGASGMDRVELVGHGEFLSQAADELDRASSPAQRHFRLYAISAALRTLASGRDDAEPSRLRDFAELAIDRIASGAAAGSPGAFASVLRETGAVLRGANDTGNDAALGARLNDIISRLLALTGVAAAAAPGAPAPAPAPQARPAAPTFVRAPSAPAAPIPVAATGPAPFSAPMPAAAVSFNEEGADLPGSFVTYSRLMRERGAGAPDLNELLRQSSTAAPAAVPVRAPAPAPATAQAPVLPPRLTPVPAATTPPAAPRPIAPPVHVSGDSSPARVMAAVSVPPAPAPATTAPAAGPGDDIVDVAALSYRGRRALERAAAVREEITQLRAARKPITSWQPLLEELLDLIELAQQGDA